MIRAYTRIGLMSWYNTIALASWFMIKDVARFLLSKLVLLSRILYRQLRSQRGGSTFFPLKALDGITIKFHDRYTKMLGIMASISTYIQPQVRKKRFSVFTLTTGEESHIAKSRWRTELWSRRCVRAISFLLEWRLLP